MKRRTLLGLLTAALCPVPPPGLPEVRKPRPHQAMVGSLEQKQRELQKAIAEAWVQRKRMEYERLVKKA